MTLVELSILLIPLLLVLILTFYTGAVYLAWWGLNAAELIDKPVTLGTSVVIAFILWLLSVALKR